MNDKDKEAFESWCCSDAGDTMLSTGEPEWVWLAACEYKQKEIDELKQKIEAAEIAYKSNQQAALLSVTLSDKNRELENEVNELCKQLKHEHDLYKKHLKIYEDENAKLRERVKFYAEPWERGELDGELLIRKIGSYDPFVEAHYKARQVLKELEEK